MCAFKFDNCIDCRAWEGFWETAVTSPDWMKAFDAPESPREISPRFSDCALAVMGFMAANYPARIESKCKCRQQRSSPVYQGTSRAWHWHCWMVRQIGTISAVLLGRREIVRKIRNNWGSSWANIRKIRSIEGQGDDQVNCSRALFPDYHCMQLKTTQQPKETRKVGHDSNFSSAPALRCWVTWV